MLRFGREALAPTLIAPETLAEATSVQFPGLEGVLPGFGRQTPNDWGLGFELRDAKSPHWTGSQNSARTYGHFGSKPGTATFLWIDPERQLVCAALADESFGPWAAAPGRRSPTPSSAKEVEQQPVELVRPLEAREVAGALDRLQPGAGNLRGELAGDRLDVLDVLGADDDERRRVDLGEPCLAGTSGQTAFTCPSTGSCCS